MTTNFYGIWNCNYDNKIVINKKKERFLKFFKIKCVFLFNIIQVKMKRNAMSVVKKNRKKKHSKLPIEKNKKISKDACNKNFKNKKSKRLQPKKRLLYKYVILGSYIKNFE